MHFLTALLTKGNPSLLTRTQYSILLSNISFPSEQQLSYTPHRTAIAAYFEQILCTDLQIYGRRLLTLNKQIILFSSRK